MVLIKLTIQYNTATYCNNASRCSGVTDNLQTSLQLSTFAGTSSDGNSSQTHFHPLLFFALVREEKSPTSRSDRSGVTAPSLHVALATRWLSLPFVASASCVNSTPAASRRLLFQRKNRSDHFHFVSPAKNPVGFAEAANLKRDCRLCHVCH